MMRSLRVGFLDPFEIIPLVYAEEQGWFREAGFRLSPQWDLGWHALEHSLSNAEIDAVAVPIFQPLLRDLGIIESAVELSPICGLTWSHYQVLAKEDSPANHPVEGATILAGTAGWYNNDWFLMRELMKSGTYPSSCIFEDVPVPYAAKRHFLESGKVHLIWLKGIELARLLETAAGVVPVRWKNKNATLFPSSILAMNRQNGWSDATQRQIWEICQRAGTTCDRELEAKDFLRMVHHYWQIKDVSDWYARLEAIQGIPHYSKAQRVPNSRFFGEDARLCYEAVAQALPDSNQKIKKLRELAVDLFLTAV